MKRLIVSALVAILFGFAVWAVIAGGHGPGSGYRVDAIFDTAKGVIPGQLVKIAGARTGQIEDVRLTRDFKARVQMRVDGRFAPFRSDARCSIQPEGLIGENFVACEPGTPDGHPLRGHGGEAPTVPASQNTAPVSFTDLFDIATTPVRERVPIVIGTFGLAAAGRGTELNDVLRRANPTLMDARAVLRIFARQRESLGTAIDATDAVAAQLSDRRDRVVDFVARAADVTGRIAARRTELQAAIRDLPPLLARTGPALASLDGVIADGTPVLRDLRTAAPEVHRLAGELQPFSRAALPAIRSLGEVAVTARPVVRRAVGPVDLLRRFARPARPVGTMLATALDSARDAGFVENLLRGAYQVAESSARYDEFSHMLAILLTTNDCSQLADAPVAGCNAFYGQPAATRARRTRAQRQVHRADPPAPGPLRDDAPVPAAETAPAPIEVLEDLVPKLPRTGVGAVDEIIGSAGEPDTKQAQDLLDFLLK